MILLKEKQLDFKNCKSEYTVLEDEYVQLQEDNVELLAAVSALKSELASNSACSDELGDFTIETKSGRRYSPAIRADQVPSSIDQLQLPQRACANHMRKDELKNHQ